MRVPSLQAQASECCSLDGARCMPVPLRKRAAGAQAGTRDPWRGADDTVACAPRRAIFTAARAGWLKGSRFCFQ